LGSERREEEEEEEEEEETNVKKGRKGVLLLLKPILLRSIPSIYLALQHPLTFHFLSPVKRQSQKNTHSPHSYRSSFLS